MKTGKRFHGQMDSLVPLQIVISIKALRALVTFEGSIVGNRLRVLVLLVVVHVLRICSVSAIELWHYPMLHIANHGHLTSGTVDVRHDGTLHRRK